MGDKKRSGPKPGSGRLGIPARLENGETNPIYQKAYRDTTQAKRSAANLTRYRKLRAAGRCGSCGEPSGNKSQCPVCAEEHTWQMRKTKTGASKMEFLAIWDTQNGKCAICLQKLEEFRKAHADHCHKTGKFRGILCAGCNHALGNLRDNPITAERAAAYLRLHQIPEIEH